VALDIVHSFKKKKKTYNSNKNNEFYLFLNEVGTTGQNKKKLIHFPSQVFFHTEISCKVSFTDIIKIIVMSKYKIFVCIWIYIYNV